MTDPVRRTALDFFVAGQNTEAQAGAKVSVRLSAHAVDVQTRAAVMIEEQTGVTGEDGRLRFYVWPNGDSGTFYHVTIETPDGRRKKDRIVVPVADRVDYAPFSGVVPPPLDAATSASIQAIAAAQEARAWAESVTDAPLIDEASGLMAFYYVDDTNTPRIGALPMRSLAAMLERLTLVVRAETVQQVDGGVLVTLPPEASGMRVRAVTMGRYVTGFLVGTRQTEAGVYCPDLTLEQAQEGIYLTGVLL